MMEHLAAAARAAAPAFAARAVERIGPRIETIAVALRKTDRPGGGLPLPFF
jgi:hypothetical protein